MPITRKPKPSNGQISSAAVTALIGRGGSPSRSGNVSHGGVDMPVVVRIPQGLLHSIDRLVGLRVPKSSRHRWLLEAFHEKLMRERKQSETVQRA